MYTQNRNRLTDIGNKTCGYQKGEGGVEGCDQQVQTIIFKIDKQQGYKAWHRELIILIML